MRLKSDIWVKAYLRRCGAEGVPAVVVRRGDSDAGVIIIRIVRLDGTADLYGPAPAGYESETRDRNWICLGSGLPDAEIDARVAREIKLDSDVWVVEVEERRGRHFLDDWLARP